MSLLSWLSPAKKAGKAAPPPETSGLSRMESTKPYPPAAGHAHAHGEHDANGRPANRKGERMARRELLYSVVRDCMAKAGVLSASYKFKVLSLDGRGREFLVMVDLAREYGNGTAGLAEIEAAIAQSAKARFDIVVSAVYWRMNEHVAVGMNTGHSLLHPAVPKSAVQPEVSQPAPLVSQPSPLVSQPVPLVAAAVDAKAPPVSTPVDVKAPLSRHGDRYDAIQSDEVEAFKRALASGSSGAAALASAGGGATARDFGGQPVHGPQSYTLLTGFEDTELIEDGVAPKPGALSATQYGTPR